MESSADATSVSQLKRSLRLEGRRNIPPPEQLPPLVNDRSAKVRKKSKAEYNAIYMKSVKENPERYKEYCRKNEAKCKKYRETISQDDEKKKRSNEQAKMRMKRMRERKKIEAQSGDMLKRMTTRSNKEERAKQQEVWRIQKQLQREKLTSQKKTAINKKRRDAYKEKKKCQESQSTQTTDLSTHTPDHSPQTPASNTPAPARTDAICTPGAQRVALCRAKKAMPTNPYQYADTLRQLAEKASPRKKQAIKERQAVDPEQAKLGAMLQQAMQRLKTKNDKESRTTRSVVLRICDKYGSINARSKILTINRKTIIRKMKEKKTRRQQTSEDLTHEVGQFFETNATTLPDKKLVKNGKARQNLDMPLQDLHHQYQQQGGRAAFSTFAKNRPPHVKKMVANQLRQCLCEYCANVENKIFALNNFTNNSDCKIRHVYHAVELTTCNKTSKDCQYRRCKECGVDRLDQHLAALRDLSVPVSWYYWTTKKVTHKGKEISRKVLLKHDGTLQKLIDELKHEVRFLSEHLFRAAWQHSQFEALRTARPFPPNVVTAVMDFAENYTCILQDEVQAAHWNKNQVTLHPISTYYKCKNCDESVYESLIFVTPDLRHDHHAVHKFFTLAVNHLRTERKLMPELVVQWSDGCSCQYKSKGPFADVAASTNDFNTRVERCYFGSRHGKGPCDGEAAVVKHHVTTAVKSKRAVVTNAEQFFIYAQGSSLNKQPEEGCRHFLRSFFWVPEGVIERNRPERDIKTIPGTRDFHHVKSGSEGLLISRHLSCVCTLCLHGEGSCPNANIVGEWKENTMVLVETPGSAARGRPAGRRGRGGQRRLGDQQHKGEVQQRGGGRGAARRGRGAKNNVFTPDEPEMPETQLVSIIVNDEDVQVLSVGKVDEYQHPASAPVDLLESQPLLEKEASPGSHNQITVTAEVHQVPVHTDPALSFKDQVPGTCDGIQYLATPIRTLSVTGMISSNHLMASPGPDIVNSPEIKKGDYVKVRFNAGRKQMEYIGKVLDLDEEIQVSFLRDRGGYYTYPNMPDISWVAKEDILYKMSHPYINQRDQIKFE